jgi:hypothetical protein
LLHSLYALCKIQEIAALARRYNIYNVAGLIVHETRIGVVERALAQLTAKGTAKDNDREVQEVIISYSRDTLEQLVNMLLRPSHRTVVFSGERGGGSNLARGVLYEIPR